MTDKEYCMSSYMAFRYIEDDRKDFHDKLHHKNFRPVPSKEKIPVHTADDIDRAIERQFEKLRDKKLGILLSGGVDSAMTLNEELIRLRQQVKEQEKEIRRLKKENDFLEEASAFFAAIRLKSAKTKE